MKVLLVDADSPRENLALMKISKLHKLKGDEVFLKRGFDLNLPLECLNPDKIYVSCIFDWNRKAVLEFIEKANARFDVEYGGSGIDLVKTLPDEIEHLIPDYRLYGIDYSVGFTSRGCIRRCPWCLVPKKEGYIKDHAPLNEFLHPLHKKLILYDNNFLASPKWYENLIEIIARKTRICFNQGLDIRLIDQENARLLAKAHLRDDQFKEKRIYYSFDLPQIEAEVLKGIEILKRAGFKGDQQMCYVLVGYNTTYEEDMHRIKVLTKEGVLPYVMPYNNRKDSYYPHLERWINHRYYEVVPWEKYDSGDSQKIIQRLIAKPKRIY